MTSHMTRRPSRAMTASALAGTALCLSLAGLATPAEAEAELAPGILITGGPEPLPTKQVASSYTIISQEEIETQQMRTLVDALQTVPGMSIVQSGGRGTLTSVFMRGANSNQTLVLLDGQPISDPSSPNGAFDFSNFLLADVERIEVVRGPQSALYGSQAIGGVINIITKKGEGPTSASLFAEGGTLGSVNSRASVNGEAGGVGYYGTFAFDYTNGNDITPHRYRALPAGGFAEEEKDGNTNYTGSLALDGDITDQLAASGFVQYTHSDADLDGDLPQDLYNEGKTDKWFANASLDGSFLDGAWRPKLTGSFTDYDRRDKNLADRYSTTIVDTTNRGSRYAARLDNRFDYGPNIAMNVGASYEHNSLESNGTQNFGGFIIRSLSEADDNQYAMFGSAHMTAMDAFFATLNLRYDMPVDFDNAFTWTIAPGYEIEETGTKLFASYGTGFKIPALYERFGSTANSFGGVYYGNPNLEPEKSTGYDIGFEQSLLGGDAGFGTTYFNNRIENGVLTVFLPSGDSTSANAGPEFRTQGFESFIAWSPLDTVSTRVDYTYTLINRFNSQLLRRPRHQVNARAAWQPTDAITLGTTLAWVDVYRDIARNSGFPTTYVNPAPYTVWNVSGAYELNEMVTLNARIDNLLNQDYEPADGFEAAGIQAWAGVELTF